MGYGLLLSLSLGPTPAEIITETGFLLLAALVLLADLYPLVPSMKDVRAKVTFAWSAAMSLAAVLAYGPSASLLFLISGLTAALSRRSGPWWQTAVEHGDLRGDRACCCLAVRDLRDLRPADAAGRVAIDHLGTGAGRRRGRAVFAVARRWR